MADGIPPEGTVNVPASDAPFRKLVDSTAMISIARFVMPVIIGALWWFLTTMLTDLKAGQKEALGELRDGQKQVWLQIGKMVDAQATSNAIQSGLSAQVTNTAQQLTHLQTQF